MQGAERDPERVEKLDALVARFAASGYSPDGAHIEDDHPIEHGHGHAHGADGGVRRFDHRGHEVEIVTRYEVVIDGEQWEGALMVKLDGTVIYHGLPQYVVPSAVELVRAVIDTTYEAPTEVKDAVRAAREER